MRPGKKIKTFYRIPDIECHVVLVKAFTVMEEGPPLAVSGTVNKPITGAAFRKGVVLNE